MPPHSPPRSPLSLLPLAFAFALGPAHAQPFDDISGALGLTSTIDPSFSNQLTVGVSLADLDGDGHLDLLAVIADQLLLYRGSPSGLSRADTSGLLARGERVEGHTLFDLDGDGDLDLWLGRHGQSRLLLNESGTFVDATAERLPAILDQDTVAVPVDLDGDGHLDLFVSRYVDRNSFPFHRCATNLFLHNDGHGRLHDRTAALGLNDRRGCTLLTVAHDVDGDGLLDLLVINDFAQTAGPNELWIQTGRGPDGLPRFEERAAELGFIARAYGMGVAIGDPDLDGRLDYVITNIGAPVSLTFDPTEGRFLPTSPLWRPPLRFADSDAMATWVGRFEDLDGDGAEDLILAGSRLGSADFLANRDPPESPILLANPSGGWTEVPLGSAVAPARDFAFGDLDGDGSPEIVTALNDGSIGIWRNTARATPPTTLALHPRHTASAWGAILTLRCGELARRRHLIGGLEYGQSSEARVTIDLPAPCAAAGLPAEAEVRWPSGQREVFAVRTGASHVLEESEGWNFDEESLTLRVFARTLADGAEIRVHFVALSLVDDVIDPGGDRVVTFERLPASEQPAPRFPDSPWVGLSIGSEQPAAIHRLSERDPSGNTRPSLWLATPALVAGQRVLGSLRWPSARLPFPLPDLAWALPGDDTLHAIESAPEPDGLHFALEWPHHPTIDLIAGGTRWRLHTDADWDPIRSELMAQHHVFIDSLASSAELVLRLRARDANGRPRDLTRSELTITRQGVPIVPASVAPLFDDWLTIRLRRDALSDRDRLVVSVDGLPFMQPVVVRRLSRPQDFGRAVDVTRSVCALSEPWLDADGADLGTLVVSLVDSDGQLVLDRPASAWSWSAGNGWDLRPRPPSRSFYYDAVGVASSPDSSGPGAVLFESGAAVPCELPLQHAPLRFEPSPERTRLTPLASGRESLEPGTLVTFEVIPRSLSGRAVGSGLALEVPPSLGVQVEGPVRYEGGGRYHFDATLDDVSNAQIIVTVTGQDGATTVLAEWNAESAPETTEPAPEPGPEPSSERWGEEGAEVEIEAGADTSESEVEAPEPAPQRSEGCTGGGRALWPELLTLLSLSRLLWRGRREA